MALVKGLVIAMGVIIVGGLVVIVATLVMRSGPSADDAPTEKSEVMLGAGERLAEASLSRGQMLLRIELPNGDTRLEVRDFKNGRVVATVQVKQAP